MECRKCKKEIPDESVFCNHCGAKQEAKAHKTRTRGNGEGTAYKRGKTWTACYIAGWILDEETGKAHPDKRTKGGFPSKAAALAYIPELKKNVVSDIDPKISFQRLFLRFSEQHEDRVTKSTMDCYKAAYKHYRDVWSLPFAALGIDDLQNCVDECPAGRRTRENMKALGTLMYKFAASRKLIKDNENTAQYIYVTGDKGTRPALPLSDLETIRKAIGKVPYADYIYILAYLGMRPNEMLSLTRDSYHSENGIDYLVGGFKSEAGTDRIITISPKIRQYILPLVMKADPYIFPKEDGKRMSDDWFRTKAFFPCLAACGIQRIPDKDHPAKYVPYSMRHTFSNLLKAVSGSDTDKAALMGHSDASMTKYYQSADLDSLAAITNVI